VINKYEKKSAAATSKTKKKDKEPKNNTRVQDRYGGRQRKWPVAAGHRRHLSNRKIKYDIDCSTTKENSLVLSFY